MKRILSTFSVMAILVAMIALMASCRNNNSTANIGDKKGVMLVDTTGFAQFQNWKKEHPSAVIVSDRTSRSYASSTRRSSSNSGKYQTGSMNSSSEYPAKAPEKKGWSKAAKGAAIGAGSGAILGAVINKKNRAVGAVIGGVAGGAVGYGVGRHMDKKDGRY